MKDIDKDIKNTAKDFIKLILRLYPYPGYKDDINVSDIYNKASNAEIRNFIRNLKAEYNNANLGTNNIIHSNERGHNSIVTLILSHLNNIYAHYK